ncbi:MULTISPECIES: ATP-binding protein [unclassified Streptomyces]|uniref:ATP-binding protein n=1 Tax=unclassified Streptomyces TaxID=2593676 RepID=UPI002E0EA122|nr:MULTISPECIES: ATP-binding protein [unclassified Streptomyces]WSJ38297.1 ATP-binding protein [Streptomyces sp. NBC_01321]WSP64585.1 ATP-binding protein [Streptomyces sp. NBC_01240]WSU23732.1 ATP-binding protein [Streptomyces sp. NBC_01108]
MPPLIEIVHSTLAHCAAAPQALGLVALPGGTLAPASAARCYVTTMARSWGLPPDAVDALELITGELAANALEHSASRSITVVLSRTGRTAIVGVINEGRGRATVAGAPSPDQEDGRGLLIVDALASRWGQRRACGGLLVWAEVDTGPASLLVMTPLDSDRYGEGAGPESRPWEES